MTEWLLMLHLHILNPKQEDLNKSQVIEIKGFSSEKDCEKAAEAAWSIFNARDGVQNGMQWECSESKNPGKPG